MNSGNLLHMIGTRIFKIDSEIAGIIEVKVATSAFFLDFSKLPELLYFGLTLSEKRAKNKLKSDLRDILHLHVLFRF